MIRSEVVADGSKNLAIECQVEGTQDEVGVVFEFSSLSPPPDKLRIDIVHFGIEEKAGVRLFWEGTYDKPVYICTLESRGYFDFSKIHSLQCPKGTQRMTYEFFHVTEEKLGFFQLDMERA